MRGDFFGLVLAKGGKLALIGWIGRMPEILSYICPFCESEVRVGTPCARCDRSGKKRKRVKKSWEVDSAADGLDLPDEEFDYDAFVAREFGKAGPRASGLRWYWWLLALVLLLGLAFSALWLV